MSHITIDDLEVDDLDVMARACQRLGGELRLNQMTYRWFNVWVGDSPVPRELFTDEAEYQRVVGLPYEEQRTYMENLLGKCEHAIHFPGHHCEVGLMRVGKKLVVTWDWASSLTAVLGCPGEAGYKSPLAQAYGWAKMANWCDAQGYDWSETVHPTGVIEVKYHPH